MSSDLAQLLKCSTSQENQLKKLLSPEEFEQMRGKSKQYCKKTLKTLSNAAKEARGAALEKLMFEAQKKEDERDRHLNDLAAKAEEIDKTTKATFAVTTETNGIAKGTFANTDAIKQAVQNFPGMVEVAVKQAIEAKQTEHTEELENDLDQSQKNEADEKRKRLKAEALVKKKTIQARDQKKRDAALRSQDRQELSNMTQRANNLSRRLKDSVRKLRQQRARAEGIGKQEEVVVALEFVDDDEDEQEDEENTTTFRRPAAVLEPGETTRKSMKDHLVKMGASAAKYVEPEEKEEKEDAKEKPPPDDVEEEEDEFETY